MNAIDLFNKDRSLARDKKDPYASLCTLATVSAGGEPHARTLVLRDVDDGKTMRLGIFVNQTSPKINQFNQSRLVTIVTYFDSLSLQYRIRCSLEMISPSIVHASWLLRPSAPKRMDWLYENFPQSSAIDSRKTLLTIFDETQVEEKAPGSARGFFINPESIERLDLNQSNGIHMRQLFEKSGAGWKSTTLLP